MSEDLHKLCVTLQRAGSAAELTDNGYQTIHPQHLTGLLEQMS